MIDLPCPLTKDIGRDNPSNNQSRAGLRSVLSVNLAIEGVSEKELMNNHWNLIQLRPKMLISVTYPSKDDALIAAIDLSYDVRDDSTFFVEGPAGQRIDQQEINLMRFIPRHIVAETH
jgi:hypothetical protein